MDQDVIELYDNFNTKLCPYELIFGDFHHQPITPDYYNSLNDNEDDDNNNPDTPADDVFMDN